MSCQFPGCSKPVFPGSNFCSRSHRDNALQPQAIGRTCQYPGCTKSVYPGSDFCTKSHRDAQKSQTGKTCHYPGCSKPVYPGSDFCSRSHRDSAPATGANGKKCCYSGCTKDVYPGSAYCSRGHRDASGGTTTTRLNEIPVNDPKFTSVENQFKVKWLHTPQRIPTVKHIYRVDIPTNITNAYKAYRDKVESRGNFTAQNRTPGNENRRFHGTKRACNIGDNGNTTLCSLSNCSLCSIMKTSFKLNLAGTNKPWHGISHGSRLGHGIYTSATSSKSNDYSSNAGIKSTYKAMLLNKVVVGHTKKIYQDDPSLTQPPPGYDSVVGEPKSAANASTLNYDELVVYNEHAIIPAYLIVYQV